MAKLSSSTIFGKLKTVGDALIQGALTVKNTLTVTDTVTAKNGIEVEGGTIDQYATIRASSNADNGHIMLDANGGNVYLARNGGDTRLNSPRLQDNLDANGNNLNNVNKIDIQSRGGLKCSTNWLEIDGGSSGTLINYYNQNEVRIGNGSAQVEINNRYPVVSSNQGTEGYDIQKNGSDQNGVINFKT